MSAPQNQLPMQQGQSSQIAQMLAQNIVNHIVAEDVIEAKIQEKENEGKGCFKTVCAPLTIEFYQPYFSDLTNEIVRDRLIAAFFPFKNNFFQIGEGKPDLYGPFWIYASLIFSLAASGNISAYLQQSGGFAYNFDFVPTACSLVTFYAIAVPVAMTMIMKVFGSNQGYSQTLTIYGYANVCVIPVTIGCSWPNFELQWGLIIYAMVNSSMFLLTNYYSELERYMQQRRYILISFVAGSQVVMLLLFKIYFFNLVYKNSSGATWLYQEGHVEKHIVHHQ